MSLQKFVSFSKSKHWLFRFKIRHAESQQGWSNWLIQPSETYLETENTGPVAIKEIEWIDIDPFEKKSGGRLMAQEIIDHTEMISTSLNEMDIPFHLHEGLIRIIL